MTSKSGAKAVETKVEKPASGFLDFRKTNKTLLKIGNVEIQFIGVLTKETKKSCWLVKAREVGAEKFKTLAFFGGRSDSKGCYGSSEIEALTSKKGERVASDLVTV